MCGCPKGMTQLDRDWGEILREANGAQDEATLLNPAAFGDLVTLISERVPLRDEGVPKPDGPPGTVIKDLHGDTVNWTRPRIRRYTADRCPFCHEERTFGLLEGASHWSCSACLPAGSRMGGAVEWVMLMDNVSGVEAVRRLRARGWLQKLSPAGS